MRLRIALVSLVVLGIGAALFYSQWLEEPLKVSGFIEADEIRVGSRVGGRVARVAVEEGQRVKTGELLVVLEPYDLEERLAQAEADLAARRARYEKLHGGYREEEIAQSEARHERLAANLKKLIAGPRKERIAAAQARVDQSEAELELAQNVYERTKQTFEKGAVTRGEFDEAIKSLAVAQETLQARKAELEELLNGTRPEDIEQARAQLREAEEELELLREGYHPKEIAEAKASMEAAAAAVDVLKDQIEELTIEAPVNGVVEAVDLQPGDLVSANAPVLSLMDTSHLWVRAYVPEDELDIQLGQKVDVTVDSYPGERFTGEITFIARQAEFTPGNVQTPEERSKQVFRIKVALTEGLDRLRAGMAADVWLEPADQ